MFFFDQPAIQIEEMMMTCAINQDVSFAYSIPKTLPLNQTMDCRNRTALIAYTAARICVHPHWKITDIWLKTIALCKNNECSTIQKIASIAHATLCSTALLPPALAGLVVGQLLHSSAFFLSSTPYIHLKGDARIKNPSDSFSVFQLNCCLTSGGFSRLFGGLIRSNDERTKKIAETILEQDPDLVCLQEVSDLENALALHKKLSPTFTEFYFHMGYTPWIFQNHSGLFVASKAAIAKPHLQSFSDIKGTEKMVNKGYFAFSTDQAHWIITHLTPSANDLNPTDAEICTRAEEQKKILDKAKEKSAEDQKPVFVLGDFNINQGSREYKESLLFNQGVKPHAHERRTSKDLGGSCETGYLIQRNWHHQQTAQPQKLVLDYFVSLVNTNAPLVQTKIIPTFDITRPEEAISDHAGLLTVILNLA